MQIKTNQIYRSGAVKVRPDNPRVISYREKESDLIERVKEIEIVLFQLSERAKMAMASLNSCKRGLLCPSTRERKYVNEDTTIT